MRRQHGFTLLELIVTVGIIAVIAAVTATALSGARQQARMVQCTNNLRQAWSALSLYAQDNAYALPPGSAEPGVLPAPTAGVMRELLDGQIDLLFCRMYPSRHEHLDNWRKAIAEGNAGHEPHIGYVYVAGSRYTGWDVPDAELPANFAGARIDSVGDGLSHRAETVWMADLTRCTTGSAAGRQSPQNWDLTSHPSQQKEGYGGRKDFQLPDGANVLCEDGRVVFHPFGELRPRVVKTMRYYFW
jgi:prepilin-type N-terminal cleavage/methylation domain-containing protein